MTICNREAKFRCPRNMMNTKANEKLWRPQLHTVGVLAAGVCEAYYIMPPDVAKDSNMNMSLLSHTLDHVNDIVKTRGRQMPQHLVIQADNTGRETRNQYIMTWAAWLVLTNKFMSVTVEFLQVGHTHTP